MSSRTHLRSTYHLPSWQGGDVILPRCRMSSGGGYLPGERVRMTDDADGVNCPHCVRMMRKPAQAAPAIAAAPAAPAPSPISTSRQRRGPLSRWAPPSPDDGMVLSLYRGLIPRRRSMRQIAEAVADRHGLTVEDLIGPSRKGPIVAARQEAFAACHATGCFSTTRIGWFFGQRDHSTVVHGIQRHNGRVAQFSEAA